eukprot:14069461-Heterocapsa_arctica.AAC.1
MRSSRPSSTTRARKTSCLSDAIVRRPRSARAAASASRASRWPAQPRPSREAAAPRSASPPSAAAARAYGAGAGRPAVRASSREACRKCCGRA